MDNNRSAKLDREKPRKPQPYTSIIGKKGVQEERKSSSLGKKIQLVIQYDLIRIAFPHLKKHTFVYSLRNSYIHTMFSSLIHHPPLPNFYHEALLYYITLEVNNIYP